MRTAVISDIHGNLEAFEAVLSDIDSAGVDRIINLGDAIGYGPDPDAVVALLRKRSIATIVGNHEMVVVDADHMDWFNPTARQSLEKTLGMLSEDSTAFIRGLPYFLSEQGCRFVHGFPPDSPTTYLFQIADPEMIQTFETLAESICFIGHTHELRLIEYDGQQLHRGTLRRGSALLAADSRFIVNVGSVGQPRDGDNNAKYVLWDDTNRSTTLRYVPYDIAAVSEKILARGLPSAHARRLW